MDVHYVPLRSDADPLPTLRKGFPKLQGYCSFIVVGTAQHLHVLETVKDYLVSKDKKAEVGGQVLGCRPEAASGKDGDCVIYVGSGRFHPLGIAYESEKPVYILNPISSVLDKISEEELSRWNKKRKGALTKAAASESFGILVSTKPGQFNLDEALNLKSLLESKQKKAYLIAGDELSPANVLGLDVDCFVNTACPRIADDDYHRPVVNAVELRQLIPHL